LIEINATPATLRDAHHSIWEVGMTVQDTMVVVFVVCVFAVFGILLGFASWDETRRMRKLGRTSPHVTKTAEREEVRH
jgi:hypothetical protein